VISGSCRVGTTIRNMLCIWTAVSQSTVALERMFGEACVVRSEVWEVIANLKWVAFGTPMFSRRLDAG
jgi:hypothetical protein